jgi:hypothetical protein
MISWLKAGVRKLGAVCVLASAVMLVAPVAEAENVLLATGSALGGKQTWTSDLDIDSPGILTMRVSDLGVPFTIIERLDSLSFSVMSPTGVVASRMGEGLLAVDISTPGLYFLNISSTPNATSRFQLGLVSWYATFEPLAAVPLPAAVWLLLAGFAWAMGLQRGRAKLEGSGLRGLLSWRRSEVAA